MPSPVFLIGGAVLTGQEVFKRASAFLYEQPGDAEDSQRFSIDFLNVLLIEALPYENSIRRFEGAEELELAPQLTGLNEEIPYHYAISGLALPYGLASALFEEDLDNYRGQMYRNRYIQALYDSQKFNLTSVEDVYDAAGE